MRRLRRRAPCPVWQATSGTLLLTTGMGPQALRRGLAWLLDPANELRPRRVVSAGFCGSLSADYLLGTLVQPDRVIGPTGAEWPVERTRVVGRPGGLVSLTEAVLATAERLALARRTAAVAADMESAAAVEACRRAGIPCTCLRVVSDDLSHPLPAEMARIIGEGQVHPLTLVTAVLRRPALAAELGQLAGRTRRAAVVLARGLAALLGETDGPARSAI